MNCSRSLCRPYQAGRCGDLIRFERAEHHEQAFDLRADHVILIEADPFPAGPTGGRQERPQPPLLLNRTRGQSRLGEVFLVDLAVLKAPRNWSSNSALRSGHSVSRPQAVIADASSVRASACQRGPQRTRMITGSARSEQCLRPARAMRPNGRCRPRSRAAARPCRRGCRPSPGRLRGSSSPWS